jgi:hypothetical protein
VIIGVITVIAAVIKAVNTEIEAVITGIVVVITETIVSAGRVSINTNDAYCFPSRPANQNSKLNFRLCHKAAIQIVTMIWISLFITRSIYKVWLNFFGRLTFSFPNSSQSSPNSSTGCCARSEPLPQFKETAEQYLLQPQQIRSGCAGCTGNLYAICFVKI